MMVQPIMNLNIIVTYQPGYAQQLAFPLPRPFFI